MRDTRRRRWGGAALALALCGEGPSAEADPPVGAATAVEAAAPPRVAFSEAVTQAMRGHPSAEAAEAQVRRAVALVHEARAALLPTVGVNATYTRLDDDRRLQDRIILGANQFSANVQAIVPVYAGRAWAGLHRAEDGVALARAAALDARRSLGLAAARAWVAVSSQHRMVATTERALANARAHHEFARQRLEGGVGNRLDVVRAAQEMATLRMTLATQRAARTRLQEALGVVMGVDGPRDAVDDLALEAVPGAAEALEGTTGRDDVRALATRARNAERAVAESWAEYMPSLTAVLQPFYQNPPTLTQPLTGWQAQLVLSWPLWDGGLRDGLARERRAQRDEAQSLLAGAVRQARADVRVAVAAIGEADARAEAAREASSLAEEALTLAEAAYRAGATGNLDVLDAQRRARDARAAAFMAEDDAREARLNLLIASGRFPPR
jgi:outer membrane protein TolC